MLFRERARQMEYFDHPDRVGEELRESYCSLARVNRITHFDRPFRIWLPQLLGPEKCRSLSVLDLGAGDGTLGRTLTNWSARRGWNWRITNLDLNPILPELAPDNPCVVGDALNLPFPDHSFDVVIAMTMTHHLPDDAAVIRHFQEAHRVSRHAALICDLHRNVFFHTLLGLLLLGLRCSREFRADGLLSIRRGWRVPEWRRLADSAGFPTAKIWMEHATRILLYLPKSPTPTSAIRSDLKRVSSHDSKPVR